MPLSMRTLRRVGTPSSSTLSEPRRLAMVPSSTTVTSSEATGGARRPGEGEGAFLDPRDQPRGHGLAEPPGEGGGLLAVEVALEPVPHRLVEEDARPARPQHHRHLAGGGVRGPELHERLAHRLRGEALPAVLFQEEVEAHPAAASVASDLALRAALHDDRDVEAGERPHVADRPAGWGRDHHHHVLAAEGGDDLTHPR